MFYLLEANHYGASPHSKGGEFRLHLSKGGVTKSWQPRVKTVTHLFSWEIHCALRGEEASGAGHKGLDSELRGTVKDLRITGGHDQRKGKKEPIEE